MQVTACWPYSQNPKDGIQIGSSATWVASNFTSYMPGKTFYILADKCILVLIFFKRKDEHGKKNEMTQFIHMFWNISIHFCLLKHSLRTNAELTHKPFLSKRFRTEAWCHHVWLWCAFLYRCQKSISTHQINWLLVSL